MSSLATFRQRSLIAFSILSLASFGASCRCCNKDGAHPTKAAVLVSFDGKSNATREHRIEGSDANPKVLGRVRFQGSTVSFDIESQESPPAQAEKMVVNWTSHVEGVNPIAWPAIDPGDPVHTFTIPFPNTDWFVVNIPATFDASNSNNCFHIRVDSFDHSGNSVTWGMKAYLPGLNTNWEQLKKP